MSLSVTWLWGVVAAWNLLFVAVGNDRLDNLIIGLLAANCAWLNWILERATTEDPRERRLRR